jgi:hypothetical protein
MKMNIILRDTDKNSENGRSYWVFTTKGGINITTQFKNEATVISEGQEITIAGNWWEAVGTNKKCGYYYKKETA